VLCHNSYMLWVGNNTMGGEEVEQLLHLSRREGEHVVEIDIKMVPRSDKFPEGVKYSLHLGTLNGDLLLRYDNAHGGHHVHRGDEIEEIEFEGVELLLEDFFQVVDSVVEGELVR